MACKICRFEWCWDCEATFTKGHGWLCNPFGCNISKNSVQRNRCCFILMTIVYILLAIIALPFLLVLYVPCAAAFKGSLAVNNCLVSYYSRNATRGASDEDDDDDKYIHSSRIGEPSVQIPCCSCFNIVRCLLISLTSLVCFILGLVVNCVIVPIFLILLVLCIPCYFCANTINERQQVERMADTTLLNIR